MNKTARLTCGLLFLWLWSTKAPGALSYWDSNDATPGAGATPTGTWGADAFWSADATGASPTTNWTAGDTAVFSAGTDAINPFTVTVSGTQSIGGITFQEGAVTLSGGTLALSAAAPLSVTAASTTLNSVLAGTTLTKSGTGTLFLNATNTFTGLATVSAGAVVVGNNNALGTSGGTTTVNSGAAVHFTGNRTVAESININGTGISISSSSGALRNLSGSNFLSGTITLDGNARINSDAGTLRLNTAVQGSANNYQLTVGGAGDIILAGNNLVGQFTKLTKDGSGTLTLTAYCNHRAGTVVSSGLLKLAAHEVFRVGTPLIVDAALDMNGFNASADALAGVGTITNGGTLKLGGVSNAPVFAGIIGGPTTVIKTDTNTQIFTGNHSYFGATIVSNGTLRVNGSLAAGSAVSVKAGATLAGTGTVSGPVTVEANGLLSPGISAGTMTLGGGLNLSGGGVYVWELAANSTNNPGANYDRIVLTNGTLTLGGASTLRIQFISSATAPDGTNAFWQAEQSWKIIAVNGGSNPANSSFTTIESGSFAAGNFSTSVDADGGICLNFKPPGPVTNALDFAAVTGRPFARWVTGQNPHRREDVPSVASMFNMSAGGLMRGPAGGLDADTYDWRVHYSGSLWGASPWGTWITSLEFLRKCRDTGSEPLFTANMFGGGYTNGYGTMICQFDNFTNLFNPGGYGTNPVAGTAAQLAADWVRYCNFIVPAYRKGQESLIGNDPNFTPAENEENLRVYNSLAIGGNWSGRDLLLTNGEPPVPKVVWWEIGNEPEVDLSETSILVNQHNISDKIVYRDRYRVIANAMKSVDSSIKTGPCITTANPGNEWLGRVAEDPNAPLDFAGIHPYFWLRYVWPNPTNLTAGLMAIGNFLADHARNTALTMSNYAGNTRFGTRPPGWFWTVPLIASEYNPVNWDAVDQVQRSTANGLGLVEHGFRFSHPNRTTNAYQSYLGANFWAQPQGRPALTNAFEALRDFAGDRILENPAPGPQPVPDFAPLSLPLRAYVTQQTNGANKIHVWGLNFSEYTNNTVYFNLTNLPFTPRAVFQRTFGRRDGPNSLTNSTSLGWTVQEVTDSADPAHFNLTVEPATYTIITFQENAATNWYWDTATSVGLRGGNGTWSTNQLLGNWSSSVGGENPGLAWTDGKDAIFDAALTAGGTITVTGMVSPRAVLVNKTNCNFTGAGTISLGAGGMQINAPITVTNAGSNAMLAGTGGVTVNPGVGNTVTFNCTNTYTGDTVITSGTLTLGARGGIPNSSRIFVSDSATFNVAPKTAGFILEAGQTLAGSGSVTGRVTALGIVLPGVSVGTLTFNTNLTLAGTTIMDVSRSGSTVTNDRIVCLRTLTNGGTLIVTNTGPDPLAAGDTFTLFSAQTNAGSFSSIQLPPLGYGLAWNTNGLGAGVLQVVLTVPVFSSFELSGTNLILSGSNGVTGEPYYLLTSTNVSLPLSNWTRLRTNLFGGGGSFEETIPLNPATPIEFFRLQSGM